MRVFGIMALGTVGLISSVGCAPQAEVVDKLQLTEIEGLEDATVTGVDIDTDGVLVVSTESRGALRLEADRARGLFTQSDLITNGLPSTLSDIAVMGDGRYAVTAPGVGALFDDNDNTLSLHFCYEPGDWGDWEVQRQQTNSLTYDPGLDRLIAQPQTLTDEIPDRSDVAEFDGTTGEPLLWHTLADRKWLAGAVAMDAHGPILAKDDALYDFTFGEDRPEKRVDLGGLGIDDIQGMAVDGDDLIVLDGDQLLWLRGW